MNQSVAGGLKGISRAVITAVIAFVVMVAVCATTAFAQLVSVYKVQISVDNNSFTITTNETDPVEILSQANVSLTNSDKLDIKDFKAGKGGVIRVDKLKTVNIEFTKTIRSFEVYADTVGDALNELKIVCTASDSVNYPLSTVLSDGMIIKVTSSKSISVNADGETVEYPAVSGTVKDLLKLAHISLGEDDYTVPSVNSSIRAGMTVKVYRVEYKEMTKTEKVSYKTTKKKDSSVYKGIETVVTNGTSGKADVTYEVKYVNGKATSKTEVSRETVKKAKNKVVKVGTKKTSGTTNVKANGVKSKNGYKVGQVIKGKYTHYCACGVCGSGTGKTASGKKVRNGMKDPYYIACNWLPLGSVVNIDGTNYTVVDRGGSGLSKEGRVDIFTPEGHQACFRYGTGSCTLTIIRLGW